MTPPTSEKTFTRQRIGQTRGPTLKFQGHLLASQTDDPEHERPKWVETELWETPSGAWIAVCISGTNVSDRQWVTATVIEPSDDDLARKVAVLDALDWCIVGREMVKRLKWKIERFVD